MLLIVVDDRLTENSQGQKLQLPIPLEADTVHSTRCFMLVSVRTVMSCICDSRGVQQWALEIGSLVRTGGTSAAL